MQFPQNKNKTVNSNRKCRAVSSMSVSPRLPDCNSYPSDEFDYSCAADFHKLVSIAAFGSWEVRFVNRGVARWNVLNCVMSVLCSQSLYHEHRRCVMTIIVEFILSELVIIVCNKCVRHVILHNILKYIMQYLHIDYTKLACSFQFNLEWE